MSKVEKVAKSEDAPKSTKRRMVTLAVATVLLLGSGGTSGWLMLRGSKDAKSQQPGQVLPLDAVTVNLAGGHYLKMKIALQATDDLKEKPDGSRALDLAIAQYSNRQLGELSSTEGRLKAKNQLLETVNQAYDHRIMDIYFTEFVMQ
jgi:flagellar FliL protein